MRKNVERSGRFVRARYSGGVLAKEPVDDYTGEPEVVRLGSGQMPPEYCDALGELRTIDIAMRF